MNMSTSFSACFGGAFLALPPKRYGQLLDERIAEHKPSLWLVNTGWTGGAYGTGSRMKLAHTRSMVTAALSGQLDDAKYRKDAVFGFEVPLGVPNVPPDVLDPRATWKDGTAYDAQAGKLATMFRANFKTFEGQVPEGVVKAGPVG